MHQTLAVVASSGTPHQKSIDALNKQNVKSLIVQRAPQKLDSNALRNKFLNIARTRNEARDKALQTDATHFLLVDDDIVLPENAITNLARQHRDAIGGWYRGRNGGWVGGRWVADNVFGSFTAPAPSVIETDLLPLGCCLVRRELLELIEFEAGIDVECEMRDRSRVILGDCGAFSLRVQDLGSRLWMDGSVVCEHLT